MPPPRPSRRPADALGIAADVQKRVATGFQRWAPGILGGRTNVASPVSPTERGLAVPTTVAAAGGGLSYLWAQLDNVPASGSEIPHATWTQIAIDAGFSEQIGTHFEIVGNTVEVLSNDIAVNVVIYASFDPEASNERGIRLRVNGTGASNRPIQKWVPHTGVALDTVVDASGSTRLFAGDVLTVEVYQNRAGGTPLGLASDGLMSLTVVSTEPTP